MNRNALTAVVALVAAAAGPALLPAQEVGADSVTRLEELVVSVSRTAEDTRSLTASADLIRRADAELSLATTADGALRGLAGTSVVGDGAFGQEVRLNLRGLNSGFGTQRTLVLLDGRPLTDEYLGTTDLAQYPLAAVDRIELVRGPASAAYGSNAMGGVVNLLPLRGGPGSYAEAGVQGGTFGTLNASGLYGRGIGRLDALVSLSGQSTDGYLHNSRGLAMDWDARSAFLNLGYTGDRARARTYGVYYHGRGTDEDFSRRSTRVSQDLDLAYELDPEHHATASLRTWYSHLSQDFDWFDQPDAAWRLHTVGAVATQRYVAGPLLGLTGGAEVRRQSALVEDGAGTVDRGTTLWGIFLQNRVSLGDAATLLVGVRGDGRPAGGLEPSFRAGVNLGLDRHTTLLAALGRAFRVPTISDRFLPRTGFFGLEFEGNPDLDPESASSAELGVRRVLGSATVSLTGFATDARDFWDFLPGEDGVFRPRNIARVRIHGLESEVRVRLGRTLEARGWYTFTDARYREFTGSAAAEGNRLDDNVRHSAAFALAWSHPSGHAVRLASRASGDRATDPFDPPDSRLAGFTVVDLTAVWAVTSEIRLSLGALNLLDHGYRLRPEFPQPGRGLVAGMRAAWLGHRPGA